MRLFWFLLLVTLTAVTGPAANCAEIKRVDRPVCSHILQGEIASGDLDRLKSIADGLRELCLDSPGGNFSIGMDIAEYLAGRNITTVLDEAATCLSSCAIIFMGGSYWEEGIFFAKRKMHITATLGFHAPFAVPHGANMFSSDDIKAAYATGLKSVARMLQIGANGRGGEGVIPNKLILKLLDKKPNEVYLINTVLRAKEMRIDLIGLPPVEWNARAACNACMNRNDGAHATMACSNPIAATPTRIRKNVDQVLFEGFGGEGAYACVVQFERDKNGRLIDVAIAPLVTDDDLPLKPSMLSRLNQDDGLAPSMRIGRTGLPQ